MSKNREITFIKQMIELGDWVDSAGIVACELEGMEGFEVWVHFEVNKDPDERVWICSQRNKGMTKKYKSLQAAVNVLKDLGVKSFNVQYV